MFMELTEWPFLSTTYIVMCLGATMLCYFDYMKNYEIFFDTFLIFNRGEVSFPLIVVVLATFHVVLLPRRADHLLHLLLRAVHHVLHPSGELRVPRQGRLLRLLSAHSGTDADRSHPRE